MKITPEGLQELHDYTNDGERVMQVVGAAAESLPKFVRFIGRYTSWNSLFGSGVCVLAGKIGRSHSLFLEPEFPPAVDDRSVYVASFFFDAARDEFDDRDTKHRDTHRCLAQSTLLGLLDYATEQPGGDKLRDKNYLNQLFREPIWLEALREKVSVGYGNGLPDNRPAIFRSMGYHLGSEVLADQEFSVIDQVLRSRYPEMVEALSTREVEIVGEPHNCYHWLHIHSGGGGGAEAAHFEWAVRGVHKAFAFTPEKLHEELRRCLDQGYLEFVRDHQAFFARVNQDPLP